MVVTLLIAFSSTRKRVIFMARVREAATHLQTVWLCL